MWRTDDETTSMRADVNLAKIQNVVLSQPSRIVRIDNCLHVSLRQRVHQGHCGTTFDMYVVNRRRETPATFKPTD
jgi:hypothetical protein